MVARLRAAGHAVAVLHRKPSHDLGEDIEGIQADRNDGDAVRAALHGRQFDAVFDNVYDWTHGTTADQVTATARACGAGRYIFMSSVAAYAGSDDSALAPDDHPNAYARNKAMSERALFGLRDLEVVTLRPPFIYGPGNPYYREAFFWDRFAAGRPVIVPDRGEREMQFIHVEDLANCALRCLHAPVAGEAFNVAGPPVTQLEFVRSLAAAAGCSPQVYGIPREEIERAGGSVMGPPLYFGEYLDLPPIRQDVSKAERLLDFTARPLKDGLAATFLRWKPASGERKDGPPYAFEDGLLSCGSRVRLEV